MKKEKQKPSQSQPEEEQDLGDRFAASLPGRVSFFAAALFLCFLGIWVLTAVVAQAKRPAPLQGLVHLQKFIKGFHLAGVTMGMTPEMVRSLHPEMVLDADGAQDSRGIFVADHTPYAVWFATIKETPQAYRIRFHRHYHGEDENTVLNEFGQKLGRPYSASCQRSVLTTAAKTCTVKWLRNGIDVVLTSRLIRQIGSGPYAAGIHTYVTFTATDQQTAAKRHGRSAPKQTVWLTTR